MSIMLRDLKLFDTDNHTTITLGHGDLARIEIRVAPGLNDEDIIPGLTDRRTRWSDHVTDHDLPASRMIQGVSSGCRCSIGFNLPVGACAIDALRDIERIEQDGMYKPILSPLFGAILASDIGLNAGLESVRDAPALFAQLSSRPPVINQTSLSEHEINDHVSSFLEDILSSNEIEQPDIGHLDRACFWIRLSEILWDPSFRKRIAGENISGKARKLLSLCAGARMDLNPKGQVNVSGVKFTLTGSSKRTAWPQIIEWERGRVQGKTLKYLTGYKAEYAFGNLASSFPRYKEAFSDDKLRSYANLSFSMLEDALLNAAGKVVGSFRVDLPDFTKLNSYGVESLRVWVVPGSGMWVSFEQGGQPKVSFNWLVVRPHLSRWVLPDGFVPIVHATLCALWRDLNVGGQDVMTSKDNRDLSMKETSAATALHFHGRIQWGSNDDLERILRDSYRVDWHIRNLSHGRRATRRAKLLAQSRGIVLKPGTTIVRPHKRGFPDEDASNVPIRAQGLASLVLSSS